MKKVIATIVAVPLFVTSISFLLFMAAWSFVIDHDHEYKPYYHEY